MARIFVSYSRANRSFVEELVSLLARVFSSHTVWFDEHISGGEDWWSSILGEISSCDIFIYLLSNESLESEHCQAEFREALRLQKLCLPVIIAPGTDISRSPDALGRELRRREWVDMSGGFRDYQANAKLYAAINHLLNRIPHPPLPPLSGQPVDKPDVPVVHQRRAGRKHNISGKVTTISMIGLIGITIIAIIIAVMERVDNQRSTDIAATMTPLDLVFAVGTMDMQATGEARTALAARATSYAVSTQYGLDQTAIATLWTDTPTSTSTLTPTVTPTLSPEIRALTPAASNQEWTASYRDFNGVEMALVPAGCFIMGNDPQAYYWDGSTQIEGVPDGGQQCFNAPFWIDRYEVTNLQFAQFAGEATHDSQWAGAQNPRENITWFEARDFCAKRGARLPTSAEWEYAARGPDNLIYPWGNAFVPRNVVYNPGEDFDGPSAEVGSKPGGKSWVGAYDMIGNVWEWASTAHGIYDVTNSRFTHVYPYPYVSSDGRENTETSDQTHFHIMRGGSWINLRSHIHAATYDAAPPSMPGPTVGFRCVYSPQKNR